MLELYNYDFIITNDKYKIMNKYYAHGKTTVLRHSLNVAVTSIYIYKMILYMYIKLNMIIRLLSFNKVENPKSMTFINENEMILSALLHDFYLYDWHTIKDEVKWHGFAHPIIAAKNAKKYFHINENIEKNIESHMWPLTFTKVPRTAEGMIICIADKICAIKETFMR